MEALRHLNMLKPDGWFITNLKPFINIPGYPDMALILQEIDSLKHHVSLDAEEIAKNIGSVKVANMVMLGAAIPFLDIDFSAFENAIKMIFGRKGQEIIDLNIAALKAGIAETEKFL